MSMHQLHDSLPAFLARIKHLRGTALHDAFTGEVIETGGSLWTFFDPIHHGGRLVQILLHNVISHGASDEEAFANWTQDAEAFANRKQTTEAPGA